MDKLQMFLKENVLQMFQRYQQFVMIDKWNYLQVEIVLIVHHIHELKITEHFVVMIVLTYKLLLLKVYARPAQLALNPIH